MTTRILVVDDDPSIRVMLSLALDAEGYDVTAVPNTSAALAHLHRTPTDLILLDIMMPDTDGRTLAKRLRSDRRYDDIAIVFLTALSSARDTWAGWRCGADSYVPKPFELDRLIGEIARITTARALQNA